MTKPPRNRRLTADPRPTAAVAPKKPARRGKATHKKRRGNALTLGVAGLVSLVWRVIWGSVWRLGAVVAFLVGLSTFFYYSQLPEASALFDARQRGSVTMLDREGRVFAWRGETYGTVSADKIAPVIRNAVVATEDKRFYYHLGIDPRGIAGAMRTNIQAGRGALQGAGGSTITVQVAKLLCLGQEFDPIKFKDEAAYEQSCRESSILRKIKEVPFALALEAKYSKEDILNIYMNRSYLGSGARGFEAASQRYFGHPATESTASEAAMLAGLLRAPSYFAPTSNLNRAQDRASVILGLMHEQGYLTDAEYQKAKAEPAQLSQAAAARAGGYFADWVMEAGPGFISTESSEDVTIKTTFDQRVQRAAERALAKVFDEKVAPGSKAEAAVVVMSADGAVRAMIGGRDTKVVGVFNRATQANRQVGSAFKPFVFAAALDQGMSPNDQILDGPLSIRIPGGKSWSPENYSRRYRGMISISTALSSSINTSTIRLQEAAGRDNVRRVAYDFGVSDNLPPGPALGLGAAESTLLAMTGAYAGIRNGGTAVTPYGLIELRIAGEDNALMGQAGGMGKRVISQKSAVELMWMMRQVIENGTGGRARLPGGREAGGKTGTTSNYRDAWFIGFTEQYVTGVWMGHDDNKSLTGVTGGGLPAEIWQAVMAEISEGLPMLPLGANMPQGGGNVVSPVAVDAGDGSADPLAAALNQALGAPGQGTAPRTEGSTISTDTMQGGSRPPTVVPQNSGDAADPLGDALSRALGGG